ncbi:flagellin N-terminal helical domain-containing protein [Aurantiacibacter poecillastricola]|uniref:flagellin N-terminal helical domain-containing protein n=1 Tax=Aurantiacibacter poecillastricola TaxID=3064385 RepID=UPI00273E3936|nr:flagellar biosynthesis protein FlgL [Aurantiacibacter sp. 219JJ12-13]MDP5263119.1 flagellar biosynthesis protein FlgL [Aurantiacibacter sp. 219JJ12-13]
MSLVTNSTLAFHARSRLQMGGLRERAEALQGQLSSGKRLARSSDDPVAASRLRTLQRAERLGGIDSANAARASQDLTATGDALESIAGDLIRARELAVFAASDTLSDNQREAIATEIDSLRLRIFDTANATGSSGNALFGGEGSGAAYEITAGGAIAYIGTASAGSLDLGQGQSVERGFTGPEVFTYPSAGGPGDIFNELATLAAAIRGGAADPAAAARDAMGGLDDALDTVTRAQTITGSRVAWLDVVQDREVDQSFTRTQQMADTGGVEFASTIAELQQLLTVLEASQAGFARLSNLSLFDKI